MGGFVNKFSYLELRLFIAIIISVILIVIDGKLSVFSSLKNYIENFTNSFDYLYDRPICIFEHILKIFSGYEELILENNKLRKELLLKNTELLLIDQYKQENHELHTLLNIPFCSKRYKLVAKILFMNVNLYKQQIVLNRGLNDAVYIGQPVVASLGIIGQVISVNKTSSRVLLISDVTHALSVRLKKNHHAHMILMGQGYRNYLRAEYIGNISDMQIGEILFTSGLDGRFPEGYPVATVSNMKVNKNNDHIEVYAYPTVKLQYLRYVILLWE